ncbi:hypothetical protein CHUAL_001809 [Chamberlinius hualienensis]
MMRAVSFVERLDFEFQGNMLRDAIVLGDVDNDTNNELAVGNVNGDIVVFKGADTKPWKTANGNGVIATLIVGDIFNERRNVLVSVSGEGWCSVFSFDKDDGNHDDSQTSCDDQKNVPPIHIQSLMANTKVALLCDIDGDGLIELVIGMSDRVVRSYRFTRLPQFAGTRSGGRLVAQNKWEFATQIGSVSLNYKPDGTPYLMVSQPGGTYIQLDCYKKDIEAPGQLEYHTLLSAKMRNSNVSTVIVGGIRRRDEDKRPTLYAVATLDGTIMLYDGKQLMWSLQVNHQLFAITKLDVTGNGHEEVISCSWDGVTYIVNHDQEALRFQFEETVNTFTAGHYSVLQGERVPCLVYTTFNNHIYLYYNIGITQIRTTSLISRLPNQTRITSALAKLKIDSTNHAQLQQLFSWLLYGPQDKQC